MANANVFSAYLRPVRSMQEYGADLDAADMSRLQLEQQRAQMGQQQAAAQQAQRRQNAIQSLLTQYGSDPAAMETAALGSVDTYDFGKTRRADRLSAEKATAEASKAREESDALKLQRSIQELGVHATARDAIASLDADTNVPPPLKASLRAQFEAAGDDPDKYQATLYRLIMSKAKPEQQGAALAPPKPEKPAALPQIAQLQAFRDSLPANDPRRREVQAVIDNQTRAPKYATPESAPISPTAMADAGGSSQIDLSKQFGKPSAGYRWKADGSQEPIPGGPADEKKRNSEVGKGSVSDVIGSLRDMYNQLDEAGGITNPEKGPVDNLVAGLSSSGAGQATGRMFGTKTQSMRNTVAQQRPILLQAIMKATGMSAKQMDSNAELKLYLSTATDPTLDVAANRRALDMLETMFGRGAPAQTDFVGRAPGAAPAKPAAGGFSDAEKERRYQEWKAKQK